VHVRGCARSGSDAQRAACDEFLAADHWRDALADTDLLLLAVPLDASTRGCIARAELAALPAHAVVVNIGREPLVDRVALLAALRAGRIGGAAFDGLEPIPPSDDALWTTPNLIVTPKVSALHPRLQPEFEAFAERQLRRYLLGEALEDLALLDQVTS
jgi:phosphoglycerate dehydrogenase-like enzyme